MVSTIATIRGTTEIRIMNDYTFRQITHIGQTYLKDKFAVLTAVADSLRGNNKTKVDDKDTTGKAPYKKRELYSWFTPRSGNYIVTDLDGPLNEIVGHAKKADGYARSLVAGRK